MLETLPTDYTTFQIFRFANRRRSTERLADLAKRRNLDDEVIREVLRFLAPANGDAIELLDDPFREKRHLETGWHPSRFTDGTWPVFYGAKEEDTAKAEIKYHLTAGQMTAALSAGGPIYYSRFHCAFNGMAVDLRPQTAQWKWLTDPSTKNPKCQAVGREAREGSIDAFLAPSARRASGTSVPVFSRSALSRPEVNGSAEVVVDKSTGNIELRYI